MNIQYLLYDFKLTLVIIDRNSIKNERETAVFATCNLETSWHEIPITIEVKKRVSEVIKNIL